MHFLCLRCLWQNFNILSYHCVSSIQTLKNALSLYKLGGAAGGSDFDPKGKSDNEVCVPYFDSSGQ